MKAGRFVVDTHEHRYPPVYTRQNLKDGIVRHQVDIWGWSLRQVTALWTSRRTT
ncbi:MAG: hypothetical protein MUO19_01955 [Dehalococcoidales bacterium]|nr:hypothetical protein [Dehalococcoidales bacterium]